MRSALFFLLLLLASTATTQIRLPRLISEGAILQREADLNIWGWASPGENVSLEFGGTMYSTQADTNGDWQVVVPPQPPGGPHRMVFHGTNTITVSNILFGDVWVCSGQSNMELTMTRVKDVYPEVIEHSSNPYIRQFLVPDKYDFVEEHQDVGAGSWKEANPANLLDFSAVAYFFARELYDRYQVPVGLINAALGGSPVEAWMSEDALARFPEAYAELQQFKDQELIRDIERKDRAKQRAWYSQLRLKDAGLISGHEWYAEDIDHSGWPMMDIPGFWADTEAGAFNGVVWFRRTIDVPGSMTGKTARLWLGRIVDQDSVYVNGQFVGRTGYQYPPRKYTVASGILKPGKNTITIRVINEQGKGGFVNDKPYFLAVGSDTIDLTGTWHYQVGTTMGALPGPTFIRWKPGGLYKAMIAPLLKYRIKGAIWYQGESNTKNPEGYYESFPALIMDWRNKWRQGAFPFIYVQLANFMEETDQPTESNWAELRQAQLSTLAVPNTAMAVIIDLGEWNDIHPLNKEDVGKRLALNAFRMVYGEAQITGSSPLPAEVSFAKKKVKIGFSNCPGGLMTRDDRPPAYFEISSDGSTFVQADAKIRGDKVLVWNPEIVNPVAVRYAWANNPARANLYSRQGLPASPFEIYK